MRRATANFFGPAPWGPEEGSKGQISLNLNYKAKFQRFLIPNFVCVFSQMKDIKHIRPHFDSDAWVMPQGWDFGTLGVRRGKQFFFKHCHVAYRIDGDDEQNRIQVKLSS